MNLKLDVLASVSIKRKKPWSKFAWLEESTPPHGLYLFGDGGRISQLSLSSGKTRRKLSTLTSIQSEIALTSSSPDGFQLGGLTLEGDLFIWHKRNDTLETFVTPLSRMGAEGEKMTAQTIKSLKLFLSDSGEEALLVTGNVELYLWGLATPSHRSLWWKLFPPKGVHLPEAAYRETAVDALFHNSPILGKTCHCICAFTNHVTKETTITCLLINWPSAAVTFYSQHTSNRPEVLTPHFVSESETNLQGEIQVDTRCFDNPVKQVHFKEDDSQHLSSGVNLKQVQSSFKAGGIVLQDRTNLHSSTSIRSSGLTVDTEKGVHESATKGEHTSVHTHFDQLAKSGSISPFETLWSTVSYNSTHNCCTLNSSLHDLTGKGTYVCRLSPTCSVVALALNQTNPTDTQVVFFSPLFKVGLPSNIYQRKIEGKCGRTFWITDMSWTSDGLLLVCITKRGGLFILPRFGPPITLIARGCSIEMGPKLFLPLHPLITVTGAPNKITDHETSQSSERDLLRQRFSVSTHPDLPIFLCSDGYSVTVLKLPSVFTLPNLLLGIVNEARDMLNLPLMAMEPKVNGHVLSRGSLPVDDGNTFSFSKSAQLHNLQQVAATFLEDTVLEDTLESTVGPDFFSAMAGADAGGIYFAGLGSTFEMTSQTQRKTYNVQQALSLLLCGWGLLLSSGCVYMGDGVQRSISPLVMQSCQSMLSSATNLLVSTVVSAINTLCTSGGVETTPTVSDFLKVLLSLVPLDSLEQSYMNTVAMLGNRILITMSEKCLRDHSTFKDKDHSLQAMVEYFQSATWNVNQISDVLDDVVALLETTYSQLPVNNTSSLFHTPGRLASRSLPTEFCLPMSSLSPAFNALANVFSLVHQDINTVQRIIKKRSKKASRTSGLMSRESIVLYDNVTNCLNDTLVALQYLNAQVGFELDDQPGKSSSSKDSNPITPLLQEDSKLSKLTSKLDQCDITGALEYAYTLITDYKTAAGGTVSTASLSVSNDSKEALLLLARVMVDYFCEQDSVLTVSVTAPSEHVIALQRQDLLRSLSQEDDVSESWNVDFTLKLFLITYSWREACDFLLRLGDWKKVFLLATTVCLHSQLMTMVEEESYARLKQFAHHIVERVILETLGLNISHGGLNVKNGPPSKQSGDGCSIANPRLAYNSRLKPVGILQPLKKETINFISETLKVCAFADVDSVLLTISATVVSEIAHCCKQLSAEVPSTIYLPAPPLFCPQPGVENEEFIQSPLEYRLRGKIAALVQDLVLVLKLSNTIVPCAQWYAGKLKQLHTTRGRAVKSFCLPRNETDMFPQGLSQLAENSSVFLTSSQGDLSSPMSVLLAIFLQLCGLLWMLHVRDEFSGGLKKIQPSASKVKKSSKDVENASHWCVRFLTFSSFIKKSGKKAHHALQETTLSVFSELPTTSVMADLLALFSATSFIDNVPSLEGKINRMLTRLRSTKDEADIQLLSVRYHAKSQLVASHVEQTFGKDFGKFCELIQMFNSGTEGATFHVHKQALKVGSLLYEYDSEYLNFLDTLLSVIVPKTEDCLSHLTKPSSDSSVLTEQHLQTPSATKVGTHCDPPYLSDFLSILKNVEIQAHPWQCVLPLLENLHSWSQKTSPLVNQGLQRETKFRHKKSKETSKKAMFKPTSLKVTLPPELLINCLQERERKHEEGDGSTLPHLPKEDRDGSNLPCFPKEDRHGSILPYLPKEDRDGSTLPHLPKEDRNGSTLLCLPKEDRDGSTLPHLPKEDRNGSALPYVPGVHSESFTNSLTSENPSSTTKERSKSLLVEDAEVDPVDIQQTDQSTRTLPDNISEDGERVSSVETPPLIKIPDGVLKGRLPANGVLSKESQKRLLSTVPLEKQMICEENDLEDSVSAGELPSGITYSIGEARQTLVSNVPSDTLTQISETLSLTLDNLSLTFDPALPSPSSSVIEPCKESIKNLVTNSENDSLQDGSKDSLSTLQTYEGSMEVLPKATQSFVTWEDVDTNEIVYTQAQQWVPAVSSDRQVNNENAMLELENGDNVLEYGNWGEGLELVKTRNGDLTFTDSSSTTLVEEAHVVSRETTSNLLSTTLSASLNTTEDAEGCGEVRKLFWLQTIIVPQTLDETMSTVSEITDKVVDRQTTDINVNSQRTERIMDTQRTERGMDAQRTEREIDTQRIEREMDTQRTERGMDTQRTERIMDTQRTKREMDTQRTEREIDTHSVEREMATQTMDKDVEVLGTENRADKDVEQRRTDKDLMIDAVRTEMKEILELQQKQLTAFLKAAEAKSGLTIVSNTPRMALNSASHEVDVQRKSHDSMKRLHDVQLKLHDGPSQSQVIPSENITPTLNMEDLQSPMGSSNSLVLASSSLSSLHTTDMREPDVEKMKLGTSLRKVKRQREQTNEHTKPNVVSSELTVDTFSVDSPGAIPTISSSIATPLPVQNRTQTNQPIMSTPKPSKTSIHSPIPIQLSDIPGPIPIQVSNIPGPIPSQVGETKRPSGYPLLHVPLSVPGSNFEQSGPHPQENLSKAKLEEAYPALVHNLMFITPQPVRAVPPTAAQQYTENSGGKLSSIPPLLRPERETKPQRGSQPFLQTLPSQPSSNIPKLLTLTGVIPHSSNPPTHHHLHVPPTYPNHAPPTNYSQAPPTHTNHAPPTKYGHVPPTHINHAPPTYPIILHRDPHPLSNQSNYQLPHIPVTPFIPMLLPSPHVRTKQPSSDKHPHGPRLLQANDPLSSLKQNKPRMLNIPESIPQFHPLRPFSIGTDHQPVSQVSASCQTDKHFDDHIGDNFMVQQVKKHENESSPVHSLSAPLTISSISEATIVSDSCSTAEHSSHVSNAPLFTVERKRSRKQKPSKRKANQGIPNKTNFQPLNDNQGDLSSASTSSHAAHESRANKSRRNISETDSRSPQADRIPLLRQPILSKESNRAYPDDIHLDSLEVRRLQYQNRSQDDASSVDRHAITRRPLQFQKDLSSQFDSDNIQFSVAEKQTPCQTRKETSPTTSGPTDKNAQVGLLTEPTQSDSLTISSPTGLLVKQEQVTHKTTDISSPQGEEHVSKTNVGRSNRHLMSNEEYHPPILALNVTSLPLPHKVEEMSLSSLSISSVEEVGLSYSKEVVPATSNNDIDSVTEPKFEVRNQLAEFDSIDPDTHSHPKPSTIGDIPCLTPHLVAQDKPSLSGVSDLDDKEFMLSLGAVGELACSTMAGPVKSLALKRFQEIEEQLNAIENTANSVEGEFKSSKKILHIIEQLQVVTGSISDDDITPADNDITPTNDDVRQYFNDNEGDENSPVEIKLLTASQPKPHPPASGTGSLVPHVEHDDSTQYKQVHFKLHSKPTSAASSPGQEKHTALRVGKSNKEKLRDWMDAKRKERHTEFKDHRSSLRRKENHPYHSPRSVKKEETSSNLSSLRMEKQKRDQKRKFVSKRIDDAYSLMNDLLSAKPPTDSKFSTSLTSPRPLLQSATLESVNPAKKKMKTQVQDKACSATLGNVYRPPPVKRLPPRGAPGQRDGSVHLSSAKMLKRDGGRGKPGTAETYTKRNIPVLSFHAQPGGSFESTSTPKGHSSPSIKRLSVMSGLTTEEQHHITTLLASAEYEANSVSVSSGSILTDIDWEEVDRIIDC